MDHFNSVEWRRLKDFQFELGVIGIGISVLVTILGFVLYKLGGQVTLDKILSNPYARFVYACVIKPHDRRNDTGQQNALESFYAAQVGSMSRPFFFPLITLSGERL